MKQNAVTLVREAEAQARRELKEHGRVRPGAFMLVRNNPQTGAALTHPTAIGMQLEKPFGSAEEQREFIDSLKAEAARLNAVALVVSGEAEAEVEDGGQLRSERVLVLRVEEEGVIEVLHAPIEVTLKGAEMGAVVQSPGAPDIFGEGILPTNQDL